MTAYPEYRDSGMPWLGEIPSHWEVRRNSRLFAERNETGFAELPILEVSLRTGVRVRDMENLKRKQVMSDREKYKRAVKNDIAYNMMRMWQGAVGAAPEDGLVSPAYVVDRPYVEAEPRYFSYLFRTDAYKNEVDGYSRGIVKDRNRLYWEDFKRMPSCMPPREEQEAIADYLDAEAVKVRRFIRNRRRLIEVWNEQKQAIINEAVTRGLDPNAPLKPSGIDWIGNIPKHWEVTQLYRITDPARPIMYGIVLPGPDVEDGVPIVKGGNCEPGRLRLALLSKTTRVIERRYSRSRLRCDDVVYSIRGSIGAAELVTSEVEGANLTQDAARIAADPGIHPRWLLHAARSRAFFTKLKAGARGAAVRGINIRDLKRADIALPPPHEQEVIAAFIDGEARNIAQTVDRAQREIELLREYRTRLISDVVMGKLDVRGLAPAPGDEIAEADDRDEGIDNKDMLGDDEPELVEEAADVPD